MATNPTRPVDLGFRLDTYAQPRIDVQLDMVQRAESLGFHSVWSAEAYGADALSPLAYLAGLTSRIKLGTCIAQIAARPPTTLAMHAMTIDALAGGNRMIVGVGVSGPQIVEGWYGQAWGKPTTKLRDYVTILRSTLRREGPVSHSGTEISLPYDGPGSLGQGKALKSILHPMGDIPIWIAAGGPRNVALAAELADGWFPMGISGRGTLDVAGSLDAGFAARSPELPVPSAFPVFNGITVNITDDVQSVLDAMRPRTGMYVGGMGSRTHNYHREAMARAGYPEDAQRITDLWSDGRKAEAIAAVPDAYLERNALLGSPARIRERWAQGMVPTGVTGLIVSATQPEALDLIAELNTETS
ncbi:MAG: putative F420-dependent oxidoreductase [Ilumatobacteraceae bacterium]|nr:putative F420-dependent oxidoreductase [Ilumatobacteraceae bacterium]